MELLSGEMKLRLSQEMDSLMSVIPTPFDTADNYAINDRVSPEIQDIVGTLPPRENIFGTSTSIFHESLGDKLDGSNVNISQNDSRIAFDVAN